MAGSTAVAVSGGMDSLLSLALLVDELGPGNVLAVHGRFLTPNERSVDVEAGLSQACQGLGMDFHVLDLTREFEERVAARFAADYAHGLTPNPCARCNPDMKFGVLFDGCRDLGADCLATGHYVRRVGESGLARGADPERDQSYFLSLVPAGLLAQARFPLGDMRKAEVPEALAGRGLKPPLPDESREICFVPDDDYHAYLQARPELLSGPLPGPGPIVLSNGRVLGEHQGLWRYTEGQRKGLGVSYEEPLYVLAKQATSNILVVGTAEELPVRACLVGELNLLVPPDRWPERVTAQTRYRQKAAPVRIVWPEPGLLRLEFEAPADRPAPGQVAAVYDAAGRVLAGGVIQENVGV